MLRPLLLLLLAAPAWAAPPDVPKPAPAEPGIRWPEVVTPPAPTPPGPKPVAVPTLTPTLLYVIDSDVELVVLASPAGLVKVIPEAGPLKIKGTFIDAPTKVQTKTFKGKFLYSVEAVASGAVEVIAVPVGFKSAADIKRKPLLVDAGQGPQPPPTPGPNPPLTDFQAKLHAAILADKATPPQVVAYASLYRAAATTIVTDPANAGTADLLAVMQRAVKNLGLPPGCLNATANLVADELDKTLAVPNPLDAALRSQIATRFTTLATDLEAANAR